MENEDTIWVKVKKEVTGDERDIYIGTCYFNPEQANKNSQQIPNLIDNILCLGNKGHIILNGDFNARTGNLHDTIPPDKYEEFNIPTGNYRPNRNSQDKKTNTRGNEILDLCKSFDINIINGRKTGDPFGKYTCFNWNGSSVVDYLLTSDSIFNQISSFKVGEFTPWLSDHCPIYSTLEIRKGMKNNCPKTPKVNAPKRFVWSEYGKQNFLNMLNTSEYSQKLSSALELDYGDPNNVVNYVSDMLISAAEKAKIIFFFKKEQVNPPWFDTECSKVKRDMRTMEKN